MGVWRKLGRICEGLAVPGWTSGYAAVPTPLYLGGDLYRVYVSARNADNHSLPVWFDFDLATMKIQDVASTPILSLGARGCFDDAGIMPSWLLQNGSDLLMYYIGWNQGVSVPFRNSIGLAKRQPDGSWQRCFDGPILERSKEEPHFVASCAVMKREERYLKWYLSCTHWDIAQDQPRHHYHIKTAQSDDGIDWQRSGHVAIDFGPGEYAISRPCPLQEADGSLSMWFSARGDSYQIFKARSRDGFEWTRAHEPELTPSCDGWDEEMVCYPYVIDHGGERFMFYNGNGYGRSGVGLAVWGGK